MSVVWGFLPLIAIDSLRAFLLGQELMAGKDERIVGTWKTVKTDGSPIKRHECAFIEQMESSISLVGKAISPLTSMTQRPTHGLRYQTHRWKSITFNLSFSMIKSTLLVQWPANSWTKCCSPIFWYAILKLILRIKVRRFQRIGAAVLTSRKEPMSCIFNMSV